MWWGGCFLNVVSCHCRVRSETLNEEVDLLLVHLELLLSEIAHVLTHFGKLILEKLLDFAT